jgi:hypothetical protein
MTRSSQSETAENGSHPERQRHIDHLHENEHQRQRAEHTGDGDHGPVAVAPDGHEQRQIGDGREEEAERGNGQDVDDREDDAADQDQRIAALLFLALGFAAVLHQLFEQAGGGEGFADQQVLDDFIDADQPQQHQDGLGPEVRPDPPRRRRKVDAPRHLVEIHRGQLQHDIGRGAQQAVEHGGTRSGPA